MTERHIATLDDVLAESMALLAEGEADPGSAWRNPALVTLGLDGVPQARTVVLRRFDGAARQVETHTDCRSAKYGEIQANAASSLHGWDGARRVQLRLTGSVTLHTHDAAADAAWAALHPQSRATYTVVPGPGTTLGLPGQTSQVDEAAARGVFCLVRLTFAHLEYLHLGQGSHQRARFGWVQGALTATWLVP